MEPKYVKASYKGPIALITLSRPAHGNCVNAGLSMELKEACHRVERSERIRAVVITGAGSVFSSGRQTLISTNNNKMSVALEASLEDLRCSRALSDLTMPTIAAINGDAIDHGLELALACDLRIAASDARMGFRDLDLGIIPWDGGTQRLARLIGKARALGLLLTRQFISANEALAMGLVNKVEPNGEAALNAALTIASNIAEAAPIAVRYTKEAVNAAGDLPLQQGLRLEADLSLLLQTTSDRKKGVKSFLSKKKPRFTGR